MAGTYPVTFAVTRPEKFDRPQVFLRLAVILVVSPIAGALGWILGVVYVAFPVLAAILISQKDDDKFLEEDATKMKEWLRWVLALYAYIFALTDRFPTEKPEDLVDFDVRAGGNPTVGSALLRLLYSIPSAFVLALLGIISGLLLIVAAIAILITENYPAGLYNFQAGVMRWNARLLGYHASLTDEYPPFSLDTGPAGPSAAPVG